MVEQLNCFIQPESPDWFGSIGRALKDWGSQLCSKWMKQCDVLPIWSIPFGLIWLVFVLLAFMCAGGEKSLDVALWELLVDQLQNPIFKAMGIVRYEDIRWVIQFDHKRTRALQLQSDHMAPFRFVWDCFLDNCRRQFITSDCVTIDEQLVPFRGRCEFWQYMPANYGIKIFWGCDVRVLYAIANLCFSNVFSCVLLYLVTFHQYSC